MSKTVHRHLENFPKDCISCLITECVEALYWVSGSPDFQVEGQARQGWERLVMPLLAKVEGK